MVAPPGLTGGMFSDYEFLPEECVMYSKMDRIIQHCGASSVVHLFLIATNEF